MRIKATGTGRFEQIALQSQFLREESKNKMAEKTKKGSKRLNVNISNALDSTLEGLAQREETNKSEILRKAIALFDLVVTEKEKGGKLIVIDENNNIKKEIIGL